jgi:hypothetical protein
MRSRRLNWLQLPGFTLVHLTHLPGLVVAQEEITAQLDPVGDSGVSGTATLIAAGDGSNVELVIKGFSPGLDARSAMHAGTNTIPSASFAALPDLKADATGRTTATGSVLFRGTENIKLATMADGEHIIAIQAGGQIVARAVIPNSAPCSVS